MFKVKVSKKLSRNDTGETNSHQSGISIVKEIALSDIFPKMPKEILNPRNTISFFDEEGREWAFQYIYYNDKYHGKPTGKSHDEFRITRVKDFIRLYDIVAGDEIWFALGQDGKRYIGFNKNVDDNANILNDGIIHIKGGWKIINM